MGGGTSTPSNTDCNNTGPNNTGPNNAGANCGGASFGGANFGGANFSGAKFGNISSANTTMSSPHAARSLSRVMNCGEDPLRIYLQEKKLDASSFTYVQGSTTYLKDSETPSIVIPAKGSESFGGSPAFASVFVQCSTNPEVVKGTIYVSVPIPAGRSFIVTPNHEIKLQKEGCNNKWLDEDGVDHTPK